MTTYTVDPSSNRLLGLSGGQNRNYGYDSLGNVTIAGSDTYSYDAFNRMTSAKRGSVITTYWTNALGQSDLPPFAVPVVTGKALG